MIPPLDLCYITDRLSLGCRPLLSVTQAAIDAGIDLIQIREKDLGTRALTEIAEAAMEGVGGQATRVVINDRLDVALAVRAHGVHLGSQSMSASKARRAVPPAFLIGVSCHSAEEVWTAESDGADYALLGPIFETASKLRYGAPLGLGVLERAARGVRRMPVLALGGMTVERVRECLTAGATGIAGISIFQQCDAVAERVRALRREFAGAAVAQPPGDSGRRESP
jgi:thiamine-phosphate pyrophosphorylase